MVGSNNLNWQDIYNQIWDKNLPRITNTKNLLEKLCNKKLNILDSNIDGDELLQKGSNGFTHKRSDGLLGIEGSDALIIVSGTDGKKIDIDSPIWVLPENIEVAMQSKNSEIYSIHHMEVEKFIKVIKFDNDFYQKYKNNLFETIFPFVHDQEIKYCAIPSTDKAIEHFELFINIL